MMTESGPVPGMGLPGGVNPLDFLHKLATQRGLARPEFQQLGEQGLPHNKVFLWQCSFNNVVAQGTGRSKKEAKVAAARAVRDQLNFEELPPPPTYQSVMERKKRKFDLDPAQNEDNGAGESKKSRKYDYARHFQCYGGSQAGFMEVPYGYLPDRYFANGRNEMEQSTEPFMTDSQSFGDVNNPAINPDFAFMDPSSSVSKGFMSRLSKLDRYVIKRHTEIYPSEAHLSAVLKLVTDVEEAMKTASQEWNDNADNTVKIEGLVRVGDLAKGLLLNTDRSVSLVLLCISPPTKSMLQQLHVTIRSKVKELNSDYDTLLLEKEAAFAVSGPLNDENTSNDAMFCYVTFTSAALRKTDEETEGNGDDAKEEVTEEPQIDESNSLSTEKCLQALAELRHARWFAARASVLPSCVECIRIMRDLSRRDQVWACLSDWSVELLVERALYSAWRPLNPAASLMRVMEVIASGVLLEESEVLADPCERSEVYPTSSLTRQEREDVTKSAQGYLRLMHFRQIYKVLGMQMEEPDDCKEDDKETEPNKEESDVV